MNEWEILNNITIPHIVATLSMMTRGTYISGTFYASVGTMTEGWNKRNNEQISPGASILFGKGSEGDRGDITIWNL